jgi:hypothetical protein
MTVSLRTELSICPDRMVLDLWWGICGDESEVESEYGREVQAEIRRRGLDGHPVDRTDKGVR